MTKVDCLKEIYKNLGGTEPIQVSDDTVCEILHKIACSIKNEGLSFTITLTQNNDTYSIDKTFAEIDKAFKLNKKIVMRFNYSTYTYLIPLKMFNENKYVFKEEIGLNQTKYRLYTIVVNSDDTLGVSSADYTMSVS